MADNIREHNTEGIIGSAVFHLLLLLVFFFFTMTSTWQDEEGGGIALNFGTDAEGFGNIQPQSSSTSDVTLDNTQERELEAAPNPSQPNDSKILTTDDADATEMNIKDNKTKNDKKDAPTDIKPTDKPKTGTDTKNAAAATADANKPKVDENSLFKGKSNNSKGQGTTPGKNGDAGSPMGGAKPGNGNGGNGGPNGANGTSTGDKVEIDLKDRSVKFKPTVDDKSQEEGKVIVKIWVDKQGNVTRAEFSSAGSTNNSGVLKNAAIAAAKKTKFSPDPNAPEEQQGKMVFKFTLQ